jgi:hypothetical protein
VIEAAGGSEQEESASPAGAGGRAASAALGSKEAGLGDLRTAAIKASAFHKWERDRLEAAPVLFANPRSPSREQGQRIAALEAELARNDAIIAEVARSI